MAWSSMQYCCILNMYIEELVFSKEDRQGCACDLVGVYLESSASDSIVICHTKQAMLCVVDATIIKAKVLVKDDEVTDEWTASSLSSAAKN